MTGEMAWITQDGRDSNGDNYPTQAAIAAALGCDLRPFDVYIGPYVHHAAGKLFVGCDDDGAGAWFVCLWPGGVAPAFREPVVVHFGAYDDAEEAIAAAREAINRAEDRR